MTKWMLEIVIDLSTETRPEWCEVCADIDEGSVPARATTTAGGARVCSDCAASWAEMMPPHYCPPQGICSDCGDVHATSYSCATGPTVVIPFETNRDVADAFAWPADAQLGDLPDGSNLYDKRARSC